MQGKTICAAYARYSSLNQREASIEDQIRRCREFADSREWVIPDNLIYIDEARTASTKNNRENFRSMLATALSKNCPFKRILVDDTSRIARNTREALDVFSLLSFYGIYVYYIAQGIDTASETAEEMITINGLIDSLFLRNLAHETHRGLQGQIIKGYSAGGKRYGYYSEPVFNGKVDIYGNPLADGYLLKINVEEAAIVRRIFTLFAIEGYSARRIANTLNKELLVTGSPKPHRGHFWSITTILGSRMYGTGILNNELYIGVYKWNRTSLRRNPETGSRKTFRKDMSKWITMGKPELRIISDDLWKKAKDRQRVITETTSSRYTKGRANYSQHLLTGILKCPNCGANLVIVSSSRKTRFYGCSNNSNRGSAVCPNEEKIDKYQLEDQVVKSLYFTLDENAINYIQKKANQIIRRSRNNVYTVDNERKMIQEQMRKVSREVQNYVQAISHGFAFESVKKGLSDAEVRQDKLSEQLKGIGVVYPAIPVISKERIVDSIRDLTKLLSKSPLLGREFVARALQATKQ